MGRNNGDTIMVSSSIALLQERFRNLERMKEKRQERELLKLFSESERVSTNPSPSPIHPFQCSDHHQYVILPGRPPSQPPNQDCLLSLGPNHPQGKHLEFSSQRNNNVNGSSYSSIWPIDAPGNYFSSSSTNSSRSHFDNSDIDTSLHL